MQILFQKTKIFIENLPNVNEYVNFLFEFPLLTVLDCAVSQEDMKSAQMCLDTLQTLQKNLNLSNDSFFQIYAKFLNCFFAKKFDSEFFFAFLEDFKARHPDVQLGSRCFELTLVVALNELNENHHDFLALHSQIQSIFKTVFFSGLLCSHAQCAKPLSHM